MTVDVITHIRSKPDRINLQPIKYLLIVLDDVLKYLKLDLILKYEKYLQGSFILSCNPLAWVRILADFSLNLTIVPVAGTSFFFLLGFEIVESDLGEAANERKKVFCANSRRQSQTQIEMRKRNQFQNLVWFLLLIILVSYNHQNLAINKSKLTLLKSPSLSSD